MQIGCQHAVFSLQIDRRPRRKGARNRRRDHDKADHPELFAAQARTFSKPRTHSTIVRALPIQRKRAGQASLRLQGWRLDHFISPFSEWDFHSFSLLCTWMRTKYKEQWQRRSPKTLGAGM